MRYQDDHPHENQNYSYPKDATNNPHNNYSLYNPQSGSHYNYPPTPFDSRNVPFDPRNCPTNLHDFPTPRPGVDYNQRFYSKGDSQYVAPQENSVFSQSLAVHRRNRQTKKDSRQNTANQNNLVEKTENRMKSYSSSEHSDSSSDSSDSESDSTSDSFGSHSGRQMETNGKLNNHTSKQESLFVKTAKLIDID